MSSLLDTKKKCTCGCSTFIGHQVQRCEIVVDEYCQWVENLQCYDTEYPYGPFQCNRCGKEYNEWDDIPNAEDVQLNQ